MAHHCMPLHPGHVCPEQALSLSWPARCGYAPATVAQRLSAARSRSLFFPAAPLMGKTLTGADAVTPSMRVLAGPLVLWSPGTAPLTLISGAKAVVDAPTPPTAPQWVFGPNGAVVPGAEAAVKTDGADQKKMGAAIVEGPEVKMEPPAVVPIKAEDFAAAAMAAAAAVLPMDTAGDGQGGQPPVA